MIVENEAYFKKISFWLAQKKMYIFSAIFCLIFIGIIFYKVKPLIIKKPVNAAMSAHETYQKWKKSNYQDSKSLEKLKRIVSKNGSLRANYEGLILQGQMTQGNSFEKKDVSDNILAKVKEELPYYYEYSSAGIMIAKGEYKSALEVSMALKENLIKDISFLKDDILPAGEILYSLNLLRIALLEQKLENPQGELVAWEEFLKYLSFDNKNASEHIKNAQMTIKEMFNENKLELTDYISYRKSVISSTKS